MQVSTSFLRSGGIGNVTPSATRTSLTDGSLRGYFLSAVPYDESVGPKVANFIRFKKEGFVPDRDLIVVLTADEETSGASIQWLLAQHRDLQGGSEGGGGVQEGSSRSSGPAVTPARPAS